MDCDHLSRREKRDFLYLNFFKMLKIAIQNKGRLSDGSVNFLKSLGLKFDSPGRSLIVQCENLDVSILYMRSDDIVDCVESGIADFGIVGENVLFEKSSNLNVLAKLPFGECSLVLAVPENSWCEKFDDLRGRRIATSYPNTLSNYLCKKGLNSEIVFLSGSVEIAPALNIADAIFDITQTGSTLKANNLRIIEKLFTSRAVFIESPFLSEEKLKIINRINYENIKCC